MSIPAAWPQVLGFFGTPLVIEPSAGQLSGDAGLLPIRQFDQRIGLTRAFADALDNPRDQGLTEHTFLEMVRSRVYGILAGNEDQNDHDTLRADPVFKLLADRSPDDDLASQPTLSRFENAISIKSLKRLRDVFLDQFIASFDRPPRRCSPTSGSNWPRGSRSHHDQPCRHGCSRGSGMMWAARAGPRQRTQRPRQLGRSLCRVGVPWQIGTTSSGEPQVQDS
jgi:hypothetical protein